MERTRRRPLPAGEVSPREATIVAALCATGGVAILAALVNLDAAMLASLTILIYITIYTPLKPRTSLNTLVGAVCGAIPPMIGWVAASGTLDTRALLLGAVLFVWQLPHFLALAWMYRDDYARGGFRMLPVVDPSGRLTGRVVLLSSLVLIPLGLAVVLAGLAGAFFAVGSIVLGTGMVLLAARMAWCRDDASARHVFLASLIYLPVLLALMLLDRGPLEGWVPTIYVLAAS
jgi:protoheme IX farnesyltransferase